MKQMVKEKNISFINLEKVFVITDWEAHKLRCDYRFKIEDLTYCGTYGRDAHQLCNPDACPYVYAIVTEAREDCVKKQPYIQ